MSRWWMGCKNDAAFQRIVLKCVAENKIVVTLRGLVANKEPIGVAGYEIVRDSRMANTYEMNCATAVTAFIVLINAVAWLVGATHGGTGEL